MYLYIYIYIHVYIYIYVYLYHMYSTSSNVLISRYWSHHPLEMFVMPHSCMCHDSFILVSWLCCMYACVYIYKYTYERERERDRERVKRERETHTQTHHVCVFVSERGRARKRERESDRVRERYSKRETAQARLHSQGRRFLILWKVNFKTPLRRGNLEAFSRTAAL